MDRRSFIEFIALLSAGAAARPEQITAYEKYYIANTPGVPGDLVAVDEVWASGMASCSTRIRLEFVWDGPENKPNLTLGLNAFGGTIRWVAPVDQKIIAVKHTFAWKVTPLDPFDPRDICGQVSYIDQRTSQRFYAPIIDGGLI